MIPIGTDLELKSAPRVTVSLILINTFVYFATFSSIENFDFTPFEMYLISLFSVFLHADFYHLFGNMLFLWVFGSFLEDKIGSKRFLLYYFISEIGTELLHYTMDGSPAIGASGAISGVMGLYLFRCHYSKIQTIVPVLIYYIKANINAKWLLLYWVFRDVYDAFSAVDDHVAHWGHIGGFVTGVIIGYLNRYWTEAIIEHLYDRATDSIHKRWGLPEAEDDLLNILKIDPNNPEANLALARYFSEHSEKREKGKKYYLAAARAFYLKRNNRPAGVEVFREYLNKYNEAMAPVLHLKYAVALSDVGKYYEAAKILEPLIESHNLQGVFGERVYFSYIEYVLRAGLKEPALHAFYLFRKGMPESVLIKKAESLIRSFEPQKSKKGDIVKKADVTSKWSLIENINETTSDPVFWIIILAVVNYMPVILLIPTMILAFVMTNAIRKCSSFMGSIYTDRNKSEREGVRDFNISLFRDKACECERNEKYDDAIAYLKALIKEDKKQETHIEARYRIARLYHKKLDQPLMAISQYKILSSIAPKDHPFRRDAYEGIKEISQLNPSPAI